ncbi:MAG: hypothetical protein LBI91_05045 [Spirochaetaceae bacterium]|jgi:hypothetical protein|nr:hypothetical protein [Spirochaetaceae bacterium]
MKKYLVGIAVLVLAIGVVVVGCDNGSNDSGPKVVVTYIIPGTDYALEIRDDGTYTLTGIQDGATITSTGTYSEDNGIRVLTPEGDGDGTIIVTSKTGGGASITVSGDIPFKDADGNAVEVPLPEGPIDAEEEKPAPTPGGNSVPETNVQVYNDNGTVYTGTTKVYAVVYDEEEDDDYREFEIGDITNGKLTLKNNLPVIDSKYLYDPAYAFGEDSDISPASLKVCMMELGIPGGKYGYTTLRCLKVSETAGYEISYVYFSANGTVKGSGSQEGDDGNTYTMSIDITGTQGWNRIYDSRTISGKTVTQSAKSDLSNIPSDLKWFIN